MIRKKLNNLFDLTDRVIILTGAAGLIGSEYADILSEAGANVVLVDINNEKRNSLYEKINNKYNTNPHSIHADVGDKISVENMVDEVLDEHDKIDILINNVKYTGGFSTTFEECSLEEWNKAIQVGLTGVFLCSQAVGKQMLKQGYGNIVNVASIYGLVGADQRVYETSGINAPIHYASSKGGIVNMTRYLAAYYAGKNIRVNTLSLGGVFDNQDKEFVENYEKRTILGRMADKGDYRGAMLFLCSDASEYMTGANLVVDGGWTAW